MDLSRPVRLGHDSGLIGTDTTVLDYGCGRGDDLRGLEARGVRCFGWDPTYLPGGKRVAADVVNLGYVVNVIEDPRERDEALREAWGFAQKVLIVSARLDSEAKGLKLNRFGDGQLTKRGTFQKFYGQQELREWIDSILGVSSVAAGPGIFLVFRDERARQVFLASQYRRRAAVPRQRLSDVLFERHKGLFQPLIDFVANRGRLPGEAELPATGDIRAELGSLRRAFGIARRVTGPEQWERIREERSQDLLVYLALSRFGGRPRFSELPRDIQLDVRAFFSTYSRACKEADAVLFSAGDVAAVDQACKDAPCGKLTHDALYVHVSALPHLPSILRVYEGCARNYIGVVEEANLIKLHRLKPKVSYLAYPSFDRDPHPALAGALVVPLRTFEVKHYDFSNSENPPILHRKEMFVAYDHPHKKKYERLTRQEERWGLYEDARSIGMRDGWIRMLAAKNAQLRGHRLVRAQSSDS